ncbi:DMT family transporter [Gordonia insulae]|uniref:Spermidine export protein MdtJ n=1 Tax=Gordonia insulae TaxID=2420509 RepID=A0A3G8JMS7_9ACTN|nr:multidrug efflux SMR transporter [Gordonia insulae]AZG46198.1 Spermidine export protein MdtJ [Gordonia insulae]
MRTQAGRAWLFLVGAIVLEVTATLSMKGALHHPALYALIVVGYLGSFVCLTLVLKAQMPLGVAYGIWGASGVALTAIMSMILFDEPLTALMGVGIVLVIGGVLCVELGAQKAHADAMPARQKESAA